MTQVTEVDHPLVRHHLTRLRARETTPHEFRSLLRQLSSLLAYEATADLTAYPVSIQTPLTSMMGTQVTAKVALVPILRAGLGMVDPILDLVPHAEVWHLGVYRDETTAKPVEYYNKLPQTQPPDVVFLLDPMLATGGSACMAISAIQRWGVGSIKLLSVIASRDGVKAVTDQFPGTQIFVGQIDPDLNHHKYIVPGLGDAGDRTFNTLRYLG
ncbi:uracil phosphoribosyltransferase [Schlesneria sp. DSM 10557]|uniref:uracil phosphoribosyltransferase n=1 Tax=Schlesneria sp. DSM 10557 TaxID=3044399 RepID=UPI0035A12F01